MTPPKKKKKNVSGVTPLLDSKQTVIINFWDHLRVTLEIPLKKMVAKRSKRIKEEITANKLSMKFSKMGGNR